MPQPSPRPVSVPRRDAARRGEATPGQHPRWRPWQCLPQACADAPSPIPTTTACMPAPTARCARRRPGANRRLRSHAIHPAAMWAAATSVPPPDAARATGWARTASGPIGQAPASRQAGRRNGGGPASLRISSAPAPSDTRGPVPVGCRALSLGPWPDACPNPLPRPLRQGSVPAPTRRAHRRRRPGNPRLRNTRGSRRARHLQSLGSNRPRANPVQGARLPPIRRGGRGGKLPVPGVAIKSGLRSRFPYRHQHVRVQPRRKPHAPFAKHRHGTHKPVCLPAAIVGCRTPAKTA